MNKMLLLVIILFVLWYVIKPELFSFNKPYFMSKEETIKYFKDDRDNYVSNLSELDIIALQSSSKEDYINKIVTDARDFTPREKKILIKACAKADKFLYNNLGSIPEIIGKKIATMKWV